MNTPAAGRDAAGRGCGCVRARGGQLGWPTGQACGQSAAPMPQLPTAPRQLTPCVWTTKRRCPRSSCRCHNFDFLELHSNQALSPGVRHKLNVCAARKSSCGVVHAANVWSSIAVECALDDAIALRIERHKSGGRPVSRGARPARRMALAGLKVQGYGAQPRRA